MHTHGPHCSPGLGRDLNTNRDRLRLPLDAVRAVGFLVIKARACLVAGIVRLRHNVGAAQLVDAARHACSWRARLVLLSPALPRTMIEMKSSDWPAGDLAIAKLTPV